MLKSLYKVASKVGSGGGQGNSGGEKIGKGMPMENVIKEERKASRTNWIAGEYQRLRNLHFIWTSLLLLVKNL